MNNAKSKVYISYGQQKKGNSFKTFSSTKGVNGNHTGCGMCGAKNPLKK